MSEHPEPFAAALAAGRARDVVDAPAKTPDARYARALARIAVGRDRDARADLEACVDDMEDEARIEIAFVDARSLVSLQDGLRAAEEIAERAPPDTPVFARAWHVAGWINGRLARFGPALDALENARRAYRVLARRRELGQVYDTMGEVAAAKGQMESAFAYYAMSIVEKSLTGDRHGIALTTGNIGRANLRMGRTRSALDAFFVDLEISRDEIGDRRGVVRMWNDIGRAHLVEKKHDLALNALREAERNARAEGFSDQLFFVLKDLALCHVERGELAEARGALDEAEALLPRDDDPFRAALLAAARGAWADANGDADAVNHLIDALRTFRALDVPDHEIPTRIALARALERVGRKFDAERCLSDALEMARRRAYSRYLTTIVEEMNALELVEGAADESHRRLAFDLPDAERRGDDYVVRRRLGEGGFGDVYLAFDVLRDRLVAYKRLHFDTPRRVAERAQRLVSIRTELEAASRVRHPGVARVFAIGEDADGNAYVTQEYVDGLPLEKHARFGPTSDAREALATVARVAGALAALHEHGVIHRDLKPQNIMIRRDGGAPVLIDFGIAITPANAFDAPVGGTPNYMPKEQAEGRVFPKSDVFALGVVLYEWLTGVLPRPPEILDFPAESIVQRRSDLPASIAKLIDRMLAVEPFVRPTAVEVQVECMKAIESLPPSDVASDTSTLPIPDP